MNILLGFLTAILLIYWSLRKSQVRDSNGIPIKGGDVLAFHRGLYRHIALAIDGEYAVHLTGDGQDFDVSGILFGSSAGRTFATVRKDHILKIAGEDRFFVSNTIWEKSRKTTDEVIVQALGSVGEVRNYNLATSNCEHFVNDLITGEPSSQQVRSVVSYIIGWIAQWILLILLLWVGKMTIGKVQSWNPRSYMKTK